jgi:hypothetical protein
MPPKDDPEIQKLGKELDDLMTKIKVRLTRKYATLCCQTYIASAYWLLSKVCRN